ncbi:MAG: imidazolonepropionase [Acidimicrobiia bacterium]|nr:imidazolonepropionase [Acidimicrobiia bacterium]
MKVETIIAGGPIATMDPDRSDYGLFADAAVGVSGNRIVYVGPSAGVNAGTTVQLGGRLLTPALVDCHTHLVFGGQRIAEFERRLEGATYEDLAAAGGGILSTVASTRAADDDELFQAAAGRIRDLITSGVATVEIKSGYGLTAEHELRMLRVARRLGEMLPVRVVTSLLAAHAIPPEHTHDPDRYISEVIDEIIPAAADEGLADSVDAFLEHIAFDERHIRRVFDAASAAGLPVRLHADQLSNGGGAALAAEYGALSADHLEHVSEAGVSALAAAGTVAVLIPGASAFLNEARHPPVAAMRDAGVRMAVSTDLNPGTSPVSSVPAAMWLASARFRLTPEESLAGVTRHAAAALGLDDAGVIEVGRRADLAIWNIDDPAALSYWLGRPLCSEVWSGGRRVFERKPE